MRLRGNNGCIHRRTRNLTLRGRHTLISTIQTWVHTHKHARTLTFTHAQTLSQQMHSWKHLTWEKWHQKSHLAMTAQKRRLPLFNPSARKDRGSPEKLGEHFLFFFFFYFFFFFKQRPLHVRTTVQPTFVSRALSSFPPPFRLSGPPTGRVCRTWRRRRRSSRWLATRHVIGPDRDDNPPPRADHQQTGRAGRCSLRREGLTSWRGRQANGQIHFALQNMIQRNPLISWSCLSQRRTFFYIFILLLLFERGVQLFGRKTLAGSRPLWRQVWF